MDELRFDHWVRALAAATSRRRTLGALAAAALAPLTTAAQPEPAKCLPVGRRCRLAAQDARRGQDKGKGGKGKGRRSSCNKCCSRYGAAGPDGKPRCACKSEGIACDGDAQCCSGQCRNQTCTACPPNTVFCPDGCADLQTDPRHCGSCDRACDAGQRCVGGACVCDGTSCPRGCCAKDGSCQRGTSDQACGIGGAPCQTCDACTTCNGTQCVNASGCCGDASVCQGGRCLACANGQRCQGGECVCDATSCPNGCCDGATCVRFAQQTDTMCGTAGQTCAACPPDAPICDQGACVCPSGTTCPTSGCCANATDVCHGGSCCTPDSTATTCGSVCGKTVKNNCGQDIACPCAVFMTNLGFRGDLGGLSGADATCQQQADDAGLPGTFKAWLSDDAASPATRFTHSATPYQLVDGTVVANDWNDLTSGSLRHGIAMTATGWSSFATAWTDTQPNGQLVDAVKDCQGWTFGGSAQLGAVGVAAPDSTDAHWTDSGADPCAYGRVLYCFQQPPA
jgi:hypothetical protein